MTARMRNSLIVMLILWASSVQADQRWYVWTYEYKTVERGEAEFESYFTLSGPDLGDRQGKSTSEHQLELEVGMTDRYDFAIYQIFAQEPGSGLKYEGFKLRARYRFGEKGKNFLDPLAYGEYRGTPDLSEHTIETKLILARDMGRTNIAVNPALKFEKKDVWKVEPEYAVGMSYQITELLRIGLEAKGSESGNTLGPVVAHGTEHLWMTLGSGFAIGRREAGDPQFIIRLLLGIGL